MDDNVAALLALWDEDKSKNPQASCDASFEVDMTQASSRPALPSDVSAANAADVSVKGKAWSMTGQQQPGPTDHTIGEILHCNRRSARFTVQTGDLIRMRNNRVEAVAMVGYVQTGARPRLEVGVIDVGDDGKDALRWVEVKAVDCNAGTCDPATANRIASLAHQVTSVLADCDA